MFTVHPHSGSRAGNFAVKGLEYYLSDVRNSPLVKLTLPVDESARLLSLCAEAGFSAADLFPTADGAGKAVIDWMNVDGAVRYCNGDRIRIRTH